ncbi:GGDEF domain-containing protein (plasmid) [Klebsiella sp. WOUb02]|uniref:GGDEF domain-containing protein n=1 Tax=Klebsiella sp. WOUb02 TaxID=3161071 RepID=UPI003CF637B4
MFPRKKNKYKIEFYLMIPILCTVCFITSFHFQGVFIIWPINAFVVGVFIRNGFSASYFIFYIFVVASFMYYPFTGVDIFKISPSFLGGVLSVLVCFTLLSILYKKNNQILNGNLSFSFLFIIIISSLFFSFLSSYGFTESRVKYFFVIFFNELINYMALLPVFITQHNTYIKYSSTPSRKNTLPLFILIGSFVISPYIEGEALVALPVLGLLLCSITYSLFSVSLLTLTYYYWGLIFTSENLASDIEHANLKSFISMSIVIIIIGLSSLVIACITRKRNDHLEALKLISERDHMTGLLNRAAFLNIARGKLKQCIENNSSFSTMMLDIDNFKSINDEFGHASGDLVIMELARILKKNTRKTDITGRIGGEEFSIILYECTESLANSIAIRIKDKFSEISIEMDKGFIVTSTVSIGVVFSKPSPGDTIEDYLKKADDALYDAKNMGKNRVVFTKEGAINSMRTNFFPSDRVISEQKNTKISESDG